jgi:hypothetical protein
MIFLKHLRTSNTILENKTANAAQLVVELLQDIGQLMNPQLHVLDSEVFKNSPSIHITTITWYSPQI